MEVTIPHEGKKYRFSMPIVGATGAAVASLVLTQQKAAAQDGGQVPAEVQKGIDTAAATVEALNPISYKALSVALLPLGAFLTLAFISKVMSRI